MDGSDTRDAQHPKTKLHHSEAMNSTDFRTNPYMPAVQPHLPALQAQWVSCT